jgi:mRNA-degrading endonuclease YafQ of YafQ-DinJ toxin-antitoxin module
MYKVLSTQDFDKDFRKLTKRDVHLKLQIIKAIKLFKENVTHPSLRLHKLSGDDIWSISVNRSIRIILSIKGDRIYLLEMGTHDEVY